MKEKFVLCIVYVEGEDIYYLIKEYFFKGDMYHDKRCLSETFLNIRFYYTHYYDKELICSGRLI